MEIETSFENSETHLLALCQGKWDPDAVTETLRDIRDKARQTNHTRILIDWRNVASPKMAIYRFLAGLDIAGLLNRPMKVVALYPAELITGFGEDTAVNRGADLLVCDKEEKALQWLINSPPNKADEM